MSEFEINFRPHGNSDPYVREGWAGPEAFGRWMIGRRSRLVIPPPPNAEGSFQLSVLVGPLLRPGRIEQQPFRIVVNGTEILETSLSGVITLEVVVPEGLIAADGDSEWLFLHDGAVAPAVFETGGDLRELAVSIWSLTLFGPPPVGIGPPRDGPPVMQLRSRGGLANRMIQFMVGMAVRERVPDCAIAGVELDEWGKSTPNAGPAWAEYAVIDEQYADVAAMSDLLRRSDINKVAYRGYGQRMENFPARDICRRAFPPLTDNVTGYDERYLVINVRGGETVWGSVTDYVLIPVNFYRDLIARTGLIPVFMGQLEPNFYTAMLRSAFPGAMFVASQGVMRDFETLRRATNIVPSVSTFAWLAAWLSEARHIHLPVDGLFNPLQFQSVDLLPTDDPRYEFHLFPINHAVSPDDLPRVHAAIDGRWRSVPTAELDALRHAARRDAGRPV